MALRRLLTILALCCLGPMLGPVRPAAAQQIDVAARARELFRHDNLVAW